MPEAIGDAFDTVAGAIESVPVVGPFIVPAILTATGNPELAAMYQGTRTGMKTGDPLAGLLSAGGSYAGNVIGSDIGGEVFGNTGLGNFTAPAQNAFEDAAGMGFGQTIGSGIGSYAGNEMADSASQMLGLGTTNTANAGTPAFSPTRANVGDLPSSLSGLSGLSSRQQGTNIASQGVYGGGEGGGENQYFLNLINNRLMDNPDMSELAPVENSYLAQLGLGGNTNVNDLLKGIQNYSG